MILSLFIISGLSLLFGVFNFFKKKPTIGWLFLLVGIVGTAIALAVVSLYPEKI